MFIRSNSCISNITLNNEIVGRSIFIGKLHGFELELLIDVSRNSKEFKLNNFKLTEVVLFLLCQ